MPSIKLLRWPPFFSISCPVMEQRHGELFLSFSSALGLPPALRKDYERAAQWEPAQSERTGWNYAANHLSCAPAITAVTDQMSVNKSIENNEPLNTTPDFVMWTLLQTQGGFTRISFFFPHGADGKFLAGCVHTRGEAGSRLGGRE